MLLCNVGEESGKCGFMFLMLASAGCGGVGGILTEPKLPLSKLLMLGSIQTIVKFCNPGVPGFLLIDFIKICYTLGKY